MAQKPTGAEVNRWVAVPPKHKLSSKAQMMNRMGRPSRIKRMLKAGKKAGKIRMIVPVLISKALEPFMTSMCGKAGGQARRTKSRRVKASHLKEGVMQGDPPGFDILEGIVAKVPDLAAL